MSRFVSATEASTQKDDAWSQAQQDIDESQKRQSEQKGQDEGKSLYDVLQANKAAKQEAFEESIRLKNQFRSLDDDEVDWLDSVLESARTQEDIVRKETQNQLEAFHKQQEEVENAAFAADEGNNEASGKGEQWLYNNKKRRKPANKAIGRALKVRKSSASDRLDDHPRDLTNEDPYTSTSKSPSEGTHVTTAPQAVKGDVTSAKSHTDHPPQQHKQLDLGLGVYSSDDD